MSDWIAETLSGATRTLAQTYEQIRQEATTLFQRIGLSPHIPHIFCIGAFEGNYPCYFEIHNYAGYDTTGMPQAGDEFFVAGGRVEKPSIFIVGSGQRAITEDDRRLLWIWVGVQPKQPEELMEVFAQVNKRASEDLLYGGTISAACHTAWIPPQSGNPGGERERFFGWGKEAPPEMNLLRMMLFGLDMTEQQRLLRLTGWKGDLQLDASGRLVRRTNPSDLAT